MWFFSSPLVTADSSVVRPYLMKSSEPAYKKRRCDKPSSVRLRITFLYYYCYFSREPPLPQSACWTWLGHQQLQFCSSDLECDCRSNTSAVNAFDEIFIQDGFIWNRDRSYFSSVTSKYSVEINWIKSDARQTCHAHLGEEYENILFLN